MPYASTSDLPPQFNKYSTKGKQVARAAFNNALKEYDGDEGKAFAVAHAAAKKASGAPSKKAKGKTKRAPADNDEDD
jgi:cation transport regulator